MAIDTTATLVELALKDSDQSLSINRRIDDRSEMEKRLLYSMTLIRFIADFFFSFLIYFVCLFACLIFPIECILLRPLTPTLLDL